jgi:hypothetical protein
MNICHRQGLDKQPKHIDLQGCISNDQVSSHKLYQFKIFWQFQGESPNHLSELQLNTCLLIENTLFLLNSLHLLVTYYLYVEYDYNISKLLAQLSNSCMKHQTWPPYL